MFWRGEKKEANRRNGKLGGRPKQTEETHSNPQNPMGYLETEQTHSNPQNLKEKEKEKDIEKDIEKEKEKETIANSLEAIVVNPITTPEVFNNLFNDTNQ